MEYYPDISWENLCKVSRVLAVSKLLAAIPSDTEIQERNQEQRNLTKYHAVSHGGEETVGNYSQKIEFLIIQMRN